MKYNAVTRDWVKRMVGLFAEAYRKRKQFGFNTAEIRTLREVLKVGRRELKTWPLLGRK